MSERTDVGVCGHRLKTGRIYCSARCARKAYWKQQTAEQRQSRAGQFSAMSRKRWTPEERERVSAERARLSEEYKRGYKAGWSACERSYCNTLQRPA
jgi:hypothetical protein